MVGLNLKIKPYFQVYVDSLLFKTSRIVLY